MSRLAVEIGQRAAGFVHQKVGCRKVPVVAVAADDGDVDLAMGDPRQPQRQRADARQRHHRGMQLGERAQEPLGAEQLRAFEALARAGPAIGTPLQVAPSPATAKKNSSVTGA